MKLAETADSQLGEEVGVFANQDREKELVVSALDYLVNKASLAPGAAKTMLEAVLNERNFLGAFPELATYGWLGRHALPFQAQVKLTHPQILNPNPTIIDGVFALYDTVFDVKAFGLAYHLADKLEQKLLAKGFMVDVSGPMDVDVKTVRKEALEKLSVIEDVLRKGGSKYKVPSLNWILTARQPRPVNSRSRSWGPYKQAKELRFYPFKQAAQFTTDKPFMLVFAYLERLTPFLREDSRLTEKFLRSLARRAFIELSNDSGPLSDHDDRVSNVTLSEASTLLSAIMFIDLSTERYHVFFNPRAKNRIVPGIVDFTMNTHPVKDLASYDDFEHDNY